MWYRAERAAFNIEFQEKTYSIGQLTLRVVFNWKAYFESLRLHPIPGNLFFAIGRDLKSQVWSMFFNCHLADFFNIVQKKKMFFLVNSAMTLQFMKHSHKYGKFNAWLALIDFECKLNAKCALYMFYINFRLKSSSHFFYTFVVVRV